MVPRTPDTRRLFLFLCDQSTESECLSRKLVGTTTNNYEWASSITIGDMILLFNFQTLDLIGPMIAASETDCFE
jgi:hypothetical protein